MRDIGKNIRYYREKKGYSQEQLAQLLFVTRQTVSNYETGRSRPDVKTLVKLAGLLDIDVTDLIYGPGRFPSAAAPSGFVWAQPSFYSAFIYG